MDGFKDSTKVQYMKGGKVGTKGAAKIAKVMGEFKRGELHSGSKKGPEVTNRKQAVAIAMSEAGKKPMKKAGGGAVQGPPASAPTAAASGGFDRNRLGTLNSVTASREAPGMSVRPSFKKGMPGIKVKGSFAKGGEVEEGISTRPVDAKGRRMDMGMKPVKEAPRPAKGIGAIDIAIKAAKVARKGVPAHSGKPMIERAKGGLACMPGRKR